jgi:hypothetical protein
MQEIQHNMHLIRVIGVETLLEPTARRTRHIDLTSHNLNEVLKTVELSDSGIVDDGELARNVPTLMKHSQMAHNVAIPYGWDTRRLIYLMEYHEPIPGGVKKVYIQGYTDYYETSISGKLPPELKWYINSIIEVKDVTNRAGNRTIVPTRAFRVLYNPISGREELLEDRNTLMDLGDDLRLYEQGNLKMLRSTDIGFELAGMENALGENFIPNNYYTDKIAGFNANEDIGANVVAKAINTYRAGVSDFGDINTQLNSISKLNSTNPNIISLISFIRENRIFANNGLPVDVSYIETAELEYTFPNFFDDNVCYITEGQDTRSHLMGVRDSMVGNGEIQDNREELAINAMASEFMTSFASLALSKTVTQMSFIMANYHIPGLTHVVENDVWFMVLEMNSLITELPQTNIQKSIIQEVIDVIFPNLTDGNTMDVHIVVTFDLFGSSYIELTIDDEYPIVVPFSDAISSLTADCITDVQASNKEINNYRVLLQHTDQI